MAAETPLRVGVIGCGNIALKGHGPALKELEGVRPVAVADPLPQRREEARRLLGLQAGAAYPSHRELLDETEPAYVVVAVPQSLRAEIIEDCARAGVHVLSEKPVATRPAEGQSFAERMQRAGLQLGMVHNYLFYPEFELIKQLLAAGEVGSLRHVGLDFLGVPDHPGHADYWPRWRHDHEHAGGGILMDMIHVLYLAEYFVGEPIEAVSAVVDNLSQPGGKVEDLVLVQLTFPRAYATVQLGWGHGPGGVRVTGTEGRIVCLYRDYATGPFSDLEAVTLIGPAGRQDFAPRREPPSVETFARIHYDFAAALREAREPIAPARAGIRALSAALAVYASGLTGSLVALPLDKDGALYQSGLQGLRELAGREGSPLIVKRLFGIEAMSEGLAQ